MKPESNQNKKMSILDNQNTTTETGPKNSYKVRRNLDGEWTVLATDNNSVWVIAEPGRSYDVKADAINAAECLADGDGQVIIED
jgi:hypothetical protein